MRATDLAYFAGIIDGEGHVKVKPNEIGVILCMADIPILEWCQQQFGGKLSGRWKPEGGNARPRRMWTLNRKHGLENVASGLLPYIVLKRREIELLLTAIEHARTYPKTANALGYPVWAARRDAICEEHRAAMLARKTT